MSNNQTENERWFYLFTYHANSYANSYTNSLCSQSNSLLDICPSNHLAPNIIEEFEAKQEF